MQDFVTQQLMNDSLLKRHGRERRLYPIMEEKGVVELWMKYPRFANLALIFITIGAFNLVT